MSGLPNRPKGIKGTVGLVDAPKPPTPTEGASAWSSILYTHTNALMTEATVVTILATKVKGSFEDLVAVLIALATETA